MIVLNHDLALGVVAFAAGSASSYTAWLLYRSDQLAVIYASRVLRRATRVNTPPPPFIVRSMNVHDQGNDMTLVSDDQPEADEDEAVRTGEVNLKPLVYFAPMTIVQE